MSIVFPYEYRKGQTDIIAAISKGFAAGRPVILESGTGTGKTVAALYGVLSNLEPENRLLYLTRTNSQQLQVILEMRKVAPEGAPLLMGIRGRNSMCPMLREDATARDGTPEELGWWCNRLKNLSRKGKKGCPFFDGFLESEGDALTSVARELRPTVEEWSDEMVDRGICPYEAAKEVMKRARGVVAPYVFFFNPHIRRNLLDWMGAAPEDAAVVVDEAHNLPEYLRELGSASMGNATLERALAEAKEFGDPGIGDGMPSSRFLDGLKEVVERHLDEFVVEEDGFVPPDLLREDLMARFSAGSRALTGMAINLINVGRAVREKKLKEGGLPRSYLFAVGAFLEFWESADPGEYLKLAVGDGEGGLEAYCLNPERYAEVLRDVRFSLHMSGTLSPLEEYRDSLGLANAVMVKIPSPFSRERRLALYDVRFSTALSVLSKDDTMLERMADEVVRVLNGTGVNTGVFFTSHALKERMRGLMKGRLKGRTVFEELKGAAQWETGEIVEEFKRTEGGVLLSVMGGRLSEGVDFPGKSMEMAIIVGVPFPKPTARSKGLVRYYDARFRKGWEYVVRTPAARKLAQTAGRIIRSENDRGVVVLLDERGYRFKDVLDAKATDEPLRAVRKFLARQG